MYGQEEEGMVKELIKNVFFGLFAVCVFFGAAELACRLKYEPVQHAYDGIFEYDKDKIYRLKSNIQDGWFAGRLVQTNSFGYRDREIPVEKDKNTLRILAIGDSVTFGHGISVDDTYPERLERLLNEKFGRYRFEVINTAVPGNSPFQEYYDLKRGLVFDPDIVIIQFVINDVVEPYKIFRRYGGTGKDYHRVADVPYWHYALSEKSAFYLFLQDIFLKIRFRALTQEDIRDRAVRDEIELGWNAAADEPANSKVQEAWEECFRWLRREFQLCRSRNIPCVLMASPVDFQFLDDSRTYAQKALAKFAAENGVRYVDLLPVMREAARKQIISKYSLNAETGFSELVATHKGDLEEFWRHFFLDYDHYSPRGSGAVAAVLYPVVTDLLKKKGFEM